MIEPKIRENRFIDALNSCFPLLLSKLQEKKWPPQPTEDPKCDKKNVLSFFGWSEMSGKKVETVVKHHKQKKSTHIIYSIFIN